MSVPVFLLPRSVKYLRGTCFCTCVPTSYECKVPVSLPVFLLPRNVKYLVGKARKAFTLHPPSSGLSATEISDIVGQTYSLCQNTKIRKDGDF